MSEPTNPGQPSEAELDAAEDALDLSDMEHGLGAAVEGMRSDAPNEAEEEDLLHQASGGRRATKRSPILAAVIIAFGSYLLVSMWADFRYWMAGNEPRDLGNIADVYRDGDFIEDLDNQYVVFDGTPDVQHAARMTTGKEIFGYLRIREAGGSLFASVPREDERPSDVFTGRFEGRMRSLDAVSSYPWIEQFFNSEEILQTLDIEPEALATSIKQQSLSMPVAGEDREILLGENDTVRLVVSQADSVVQLGKTTWKRKAQAEEAIAALGYPYVEYERKAAHFHAFVVRIPEAEHDGALAKLQAGHEVPANNPDPKVGAAILPRTATYSVAPDDLGLAGESQLLFEFGDNTSSTGHRVEEGRLVPRKLDDGRLAVAVADLKAVRVERQVRVDPNGYVILVEQTPEKHRMWAILFGLVCVLVGVNAAALVVGIRRRRA